MSFAVEPCTEANEVAREVVDAAIEVHRELGPGYVESVYEMALAHELGLRGLQVERQPLVRVQYKDRVVGEGRIDVLVSNLVVVELKAVSELADVHTAQLISYLKATRLSLGLLLNFGGAQMRTGIRRVVLTNHASASRHSR